MWTAITTTHGDRDKAVVEEEEFDESTTNPVIQTVTSGKGTPYSHYFTIIS